MHTCSADLLVRLIYTYVRAVCSADHTWMCRLEIIYAILFALELMWGQVDKQLWRSRLFAPSIGSVHVCPSESSSSGEEEGRRPASASVEFGQKCWRSARAGAGFVQISSLLVYSFGRSSHDSRAAICRSHCSFPRLVASLHYSLAVFFSFQACGLWQWRLGKLASLILPFIPHSDAN